MERGFIGNPLQLNAKPCLVISNYSNIYSNGVVYLYLLVNYVKQLVTASKEVFNIFGSMCVCCAGYVL